MMLLFFLAPGAPACCKFPDHFLMKISTLCITIVTGLLIAGCGQKSSSGSAEGAPAGPRVIEISAGDTMKYSITAMEAKPGEALKVVLTNNGTLPKEVMGHNWILLKAGSDAAAFDAAASTAKATGYIPPSLTDEIIAHIDQLGPHQSGEVEFTAPTVPGDYPFLCSFPAHYQVGMHGILTVK
jgi:azurin